jgi:16S rRNA (guanine1516-N2)-methyltransferase
LRAGLASADSWLVAALQRMHLCRIDARELPPDLLAAPEVIYLDPMFPPRDKRAAVKKEMALFQLLLDSGQAGADADALLHWALQQDVARVVVKRPSRAPSLAGVAPSHQLAGKSVRFDVYVKRGLALS